MIFHAYFFALRARARRAQFNPRARARLHIGAMQRAFVALFRQADRSQEREESIVIRDATAAAASIYRGAAAAASFELLSAVCVYYGA